jgi:hypothetical protein
MLRSFYTLCFLLIIIGCTPNNSRHTEVVTDSLWVDVTTTYLPKMEQWTNRVEVVDLNEDDWPDLIFANGGNYSEPGPPERSRIFINKGENERFTEISDQVFGAATYYARVIKGADLNGDGHKDIFVGNTYQTQSQLFFGQGDLSYKNVTATHLPESLNSFGDLEFGDVDFDGDLDIVLADWGPGNNMQNQGGRTVLWLNDGKGRFTDVTSNQMPEILVQFSWDLELIDYDNDFDLDIFVSCKRCGTSRMYVNDGKGFFEDKRGLPAYTNNYEFEAMDVNKDGYLDLLTINDGEIVDGVAYSRREHLFLNDSGRVYKDFTTSHWTNEQNNGEDDNNIVYLDYDSDGDPDFLIGSLTGEDRLLINDGEGRFKLKNSILVGAPTPHTLSLMLGDINRDNKMDIIMAQGEGESDIDERIFLGYNILADSAKPIIANVKVSKDSDTSDWLIQARIHDHKSPLMDHEWQSIHLLDTVTSESIALNWYGEYLFWAGTDKNPKGLQLIAIDAAGNKRVTVLD